MSRAFFAALSALLVAGCAQTHLNASSGDQYTTGDAYATDVPMILSPPPSLVADPEADTLFSLLAAELAAQAGDYSQASRYYLDAARLSDDARVAERATRVALFARHQERALSAANRWLALEPDSLEAMQIAAVLQANAGRGREAAALLQRVRDKVGGEEGYRVVVSLLVQAEDREAALLALENLVAADPDEPTAWQAHAELALRFDEFKRARTVARAGLERFPDAVQLRLVLARALSELEDPNAALEALAAAVDAHPDRRDVRLAYARALVEVDDFERVRPEFDRLIALAPEDSELLLTTALLALEAGRFSLAQDYLERLLDSGQRTDDARYYLGRLHEQAGDLRAAVRAYDRITEGEHAQDADLRRARLIARLDGPDAARSLFARLQEDSDEQYAQSAYVAEANALRESGALDAAVRRLAQGLIQFPGAPDLLYMRGLVHERAGNVPAAEADFRAILEQDPDNATALNALGYTLADRTDRYDEAYDLIVRAYEQRPDDAAVIDSYGWVLYRLGRLDEALVKLRRAYRLMQDGEIASNLAVVLWELGERDESMAVIEEALERDPWHERLLRVQRELLD
ncbi:TPR repeat-containing protein [Thioalkalivibrio nitratireducens DSM 14787]|uniref:TPR repeat-containing protein n=1 Tax=Thioalkalivibrio nitratireducens (strain DSM 14787 / UNIQEM 213 / ALEN2) TaxID=1255043 RepID=L0DZ87_THIND|nr:tetratricopeptide repeat protein [Thioalkalivibrio nitratireducens]AGA34317.1 TPR repeat-containing protein [Thioalkalivibrio nitratireducens DSM 14787]